MKKTIRRAANTNLPALKQVLKRAVYQQPEYDSLRHGDLQAELGIADATTKLEQIIDKWLTNLVVSVDMRISQKTLKGVFSIKLVNNNYADIISMGTYTSINAAGQATVIPWLQWLLLDGNVTIVGYRFGVRPSGIIQKYSRTKRGLMFKQTSGRWTMPARFTGTLKDNFLTRAITSVQPEITKVLEQEFRKVFT